MPGGGVGPRGALRYERYTLSVTVYVRTASGDTAPLRTLQGPSTGLIEPEFIAVTTGVEAPVIPAVSEWALIPLVALLALAMIWAIRLHAL